MIAAAFTTDRSFFLDAHRGDGKRYVVRAEKKVAAFLELEAVLRGETSDAAMIFTRA
jgi:hypothetical protein